MAVFAAGPAGVHLLCHLRLPGKGSLKRCLPEHHFAVFPEDEYLDKLGRAFYTFLYLEWAAIYALHYTTGEDISDLEAGTSGQLGKRLAAAWDATPELAVLADRFNQLASKRNDLAHSHPATMTEGEVALQRLHRHKVTGSSARLEGVLADTGVARRFH